MTTREGRTMSASRMSLCLTVLVLAIAAPAAPATFYVSGDDGNDRNPGSEVEPWATLQKAADRMGPGDTVLVRAGQYAGFRVTKSGAPTLPITYKAYPGEEREAIITSALQIRAADHIVLDALALIGIPTSLALPVDDSDYVTIQNCKIHRVQAIALRLHSSHYAKIVNNTISATGLDGKIGEAIYLGQGGRDDDRWACHHVTIQGNHIFDVHEGIDVKDGCSYILIDGNTIHDIHRGHGTGITFHPSNLDARDPNYVARNNIIYNIDNPDPHRAVAIWAYSRARIYNNVIYNVQKHAIFIRNYQIDKKLHFEVYHNTFAEIGDTPIGKSKDPVVDIRNNIGVSVTGNLPFSADLFVGAPNHDYHLQSGSPAIDVGVDLGVAADIEGIARPAGRAPDMGAYEYDPGSAKSACTKVVRPGQSLQAVADAAKPGDVICIKAGTYKSFAITASGTEEAPITFKAYPGEERRAIISALIRVDSAHHIVIDGLSVTGNNLGIWVEDSNYVTVKNCKLYELSWGGIKFMRSHYGSILNNTITGLARSKGENVSGEAIYLGQGGNALENEPKHCHDIVIRGNHIYDILEGIEAKKGCYNISIENNVIHDIPSRKWAGAAITLYASELAPERDRNYIVRNNIIYNISHPEWDGAARGIFASTGALIYNNIIYNTAGSAIRASGNPRHPYRIYHNTIFHTGKPIEIKDGVITDIRNNIGPPQPGNIPFSPELFVDFNQGNFHLKEGRPAIDAGVDVGILADRDGRKRPAGNAPDMGAYEFGAEIPSGADATGSPSILWTGLGVSGTVDDATVTSVWIGSRAFAVVEGAFSGVAVLGEAETLVVVSVSAGDAAGNTTRRTLKVRGDP